MYVSIYLRKDYENICVLMTRKNKAKQSQLSRIADCVLRIAI